MAINNATNIYNPYTIIVDATGSTPYATVASGITAAVSSGAKTVFIRPGTYTENLTLVNGVNLQGDSRYSTIINGQHIIPTSGNIEISNLGLATAGNTSIFNEGGAGTCAVTIIGCEFNITGAANNYGYIYNITNSSGALKIIGCTDISTTNAISYVWNAVLTIENSTIGSLAGQNSIFDYTTNIIDSTITSSDIEMRAAQPITWQNSTLNGGTYVMYNGTTSIFYNSKINTFFQQAGNSSLTLYGCTVSSPNVPFTTNDTSSTRIDNSTINAAGWQAIQFNSATSTAQLNNVIIDSSVAGGACIAGSGTVTLNEAVFTNASGITAVAVYPNSFAGSRQWNPMTADGSLVPNVSYINTKAGALLTATLPITANVGSVIYLQGSAIGASGWQIAQNAGQNIFLDASSSTPGVTGYIASANANDGVAIVCTVADTTWNVFSSVGTITVV